MKRFKKILKLIALVLLMIVACMGGFPISLNTRDNMLKPQTHVEQVERKEEDPEEELREVKS